MGHSAGGWLTGGAIAVVVFGSAGLAPVDAASRSTPAVPVATVCEAEPFTWFGDHLLAPGEAFVAAEVVPAEPGTQLLVTGVDTAPAALSTRVGGVEVAMGSTVPGGQVTVMNMSTTELVVTSIALNIDRCHQVASAAAVPAVELPQAAGQVAPKGVPLPDTGRRMSRALIVSALCTAAAGCGLVAISRRDRRRPGTPTSGPRA